MQVDIVSEHGDERPYPCKDRYLQAFDGSPSTSRLLGRWCGQATATVVSSGQDLYLEYTSGTVDSNHDFKVIYMARRKTHLPIMASRASSAMSISTVVGAAFGVVVLLMVVTAVIICCTMYKRKKMATYDAHVETDPVYAVIGKSTRKSSAFFINLPTETVCHPTLPARDGRTAGNILLITAVETGHHSADSTDPVGEDCGKIVSDETWTPKRKESLSNVYGDLPTIHPSNTTD